MFSNKVQAIVLAAGKSTRFNTGRTKLLEKICGQEMILYITRLLESLNVPVTVVVGYQKDVVKEVIIRHHKDSVNFIVQEEQKGTGHAIMCTQPIWEREHILILNGDVPLVTSDIITALFEKHITTNADISFVTSHFSDPSGGSYGRVIKTDEKIEIIEARDFKGDVNEFCCINAGIYLFRRSFLEDHIKELTFHDTVKEFYLTDLIKIASDKKRVINTLQAPYDRIRGINNFHELWAAEQIKRADLIKYWMDRGVHFSVAQNVHIDLHVQIGAGSYIGCGVHLLGNVRIGKNCRIHEFTSLENTTISENTQIYPYSIIENARIGNFAKVGPFAYVKDHSTIGDSSIVGSFVTVQKSSIGQASQILSHNYLNNATIGNHVYIGAGTVVSNLEGIQKQQAVIEDNVYVGMNNTITAPVTIENDAFTAAGSVITEDVPAHALAIARAKQINKDGYASKVKDIKLDTASFMGAIKTNDQTPDIT